MSKGGAETIGGRVRKVRERKGISRPELARAAGMSYSSLADLENGNQKSTTKLHRLARALSVTAEYLEAGGTESTPPGPQVVTRRELGLLKAFRDATPDGKLAIEGAAAGVTGSAPFGDPQNNPILKRKTI